MQYEKFGRWYDPTTLLILILGLLGGMFLDRRVATGFAAQAERPNFQLLSEASNLIS